MTNYLVNELIYNINSKREEHLRNLKDLIRDRLQRASRGGYNYTVVEIPYWARPELEAWLNTMELDFKATDLDHQFLISFDVTEKVGTNY